MLKKLGICFLIIASCLSFNPLVARPSGHHDSGRHDSGHWDHGHNWNNHWNGNWGHNWNNWGNNWWWYNQGYNPGYYSDYYYTDYYPAATTTYVYNNYIGSSVITSTGTQNGVFIVYVNNGMAFQMSNPGFNLVGSYVDIYNQGGNSYTLMINGQSFSAVRVK